MAKITENEAKLKRVNNRLNAIGNTLRNIDNSSIVEGFVEELFYWVQRLEFFYNTMVPQQGGNPSKTYYSLTDPAIEGKIAYVNLGRGYPKETFDGHYCYVLKDVGSKIIVIPFTSLKETSGEPVEPYEVDVLIPTINSPTFNPVKMHYNHRVHLDEIRSLDKMRVKESKGYYDIPAHELLKIIQGLLSLNFNITKEQHENIGKPIDILLKECLPSLSAKNLTIEELNHLESLIQSEKQEKSNAS